MDLRAVIEFMELAKSNKEKVVEEMARLATLEAIDFYQNMKLYLQNENEDLLIGSLKKWGEHRNFDDEFSIENMNNQCWYDLCNGVLYLKDMIMATHKVFEISRNYSLDFANYKLFLIAITFIEEEVDFLYAEFKRKFSIRQMPSNAM